LPSLPFLASLNFSTTLEALHSKGLQTCYNKLLSGVIASFKWASVAPSFYTRVKPLCVAFTLDFDSELISATPIGFDQIFNSAITYQQPLSRFSEKVGVCIEP
jgi:hypothetical protein